MTKLFRIPISSAAFDQSAIYFFLAQLSNEIQLIACFGNQHIPERAHRCFAVYFYCDENFYFWPGEVDTSEGHVSVRKLASFHHIQHDVFDADTIRLLNHTEIPFPVAQMGRASELWT